MNYSSPQGLASLGRNGDSMLVHMSPSEVAGLQGLAMSRGGSLTINPQTGLPEAFSLGGFFKSLLPTLVGAGFGFTAAPLWAGIAAGAATGAVTNRENPLMGAALGGLGGYGGMGIGSALKNTMAIVNPATTAPAVTQSAVSGIGPGALGTTGEIGGANLIGSGIAGGTAGTNAAATNIMGAMKNAGVNIADPLAQDATKQALQTIPKTSNFSGVNMDPSSSFLKPTVFDQAYGASTIQPSGTMGGSTLIGEGRNLANSAASAQNPLIAASMSNSPTPGFMDTFVDQLGGSSAAMKKLGLPLAGGVLGGLEPSDIYGEPINMDEAKRKQAYDPYATLNLGNDTGLRLVAKGGYIDGYADGGDVSMNVDNQRALNLRDMPTLNVDTGKQMYSTPESVLYNSPQIVRGAYGRTSPFSRLFDFGMGAKLKDGSTVGQNLYDQMTSSRTRYAVGGTITSGGLRDLYGTIDSATNPQLSRDGYGVGRLDSLAREQAMTQAQTTGYAMGGPVSFADGGITDEIAPIEESMGLTSLMPSAVTPPTPGQAMPTGQVQNAATALSDTASSDSSIIAQVANNLRTDPNYQPKNPIEASIVKQLKGTDQTQQPQQAQGLGSIAPSQPMAPSYTASQPIGPTYYAGINAPRGFAEGGKTSMNLDRLPTLNVETGISQYNPLNYMTSDGRGMYAGRFFKDMVGANPNSPPLFRAFSRLPNDMVFNKTMAQGGYLDGPGTGLSDSIPATIEGKQPARLADGEFVVSSDVVSALGEGSSKAGSKRLYAMMDRIRQKAHGKKKQINKVPESVLPA